MTYCQQGSHYSQKLTQTLHVSTGAQGTDGTHFVSYFDAINLRTAQRR